MAKHNALCGALGIAAIVMAALATPALAAASGSAQKVDIAKSAFVPQEITIAPGTKVVWTNHDDMPHTVTSRDKSFASKGLDTDDSFEHSFAQEGDFEYRCTIHPYMTGIVHVRK